MATLGSTYISQTIAPNAEHPLAWGDQGMIAEVWRVASGGANADTVVLTPRFITDIRYVDPNVSASDNLSTTAANTNVTLTLVNGAVTNTFGAFQVMIVGRR
jgi:hypothetical protein